MAPCNGTTSTLPKMVVTLASHHSTLQWQIAMGMAQQWHHVHDHSTLEWHPAMAPSNGTTSTPPKGVEHMASSEWHPANGTQQWPRPLPKNWSNTLEWHPAMAPSNGTTSTPLLPPTIAHYNGNGTMSTPPKLVVTPPPNHTTLQWHPTMAPSNGATSTAPCNGTLGATSNPPKWFVALPPYWK